MMPGVIAMGTGAAAKIDVTIIMPCLNEAKWLPACIANAKEALTRIRAELGLNGEILIADNGSADGSQLIAKALGATLVEVSRPGYGAALTSGMKSASGTFLVMGDADGSYDFRECFEMIRALMNGADLCMGSRFKGEIKTHAMPWKNRYIGNPLLTGALNLLFGAGVSDAHCGLRALTKACFERLHLSGHGMEFASEMIIKAALKGEQIAEAPVTLSPDLRDRPPHLRPWRDGWRHLRYLLMLSPTWVFAVPATFAGALSLASLGLRRRRNLPRSERHVSHRQSMDYPRRSDDRPQSCRRTARRRDASLWRQGRLSPSGASDGPDGAVYFSRVHAGERSRGCSVRLCRLVDFVRLLDTPSLHDDRHRSSSGDGDDADCCRRAKYSGRISSCDHQWS